jgi:hypothetical protein
MLVLTACIFTVIRRTTVRKSHTGSLETATRRESYGQPDAARPRPVVRILLALLGVVIVLFWLSVLLAVL